MEEKAIEEKEMEKTKTGKTRGKETDREKKQEVPQDKTNENEKKHKNIRWIHINEKYMSICRYVIFVLVVATVIYMLVSHISSTVRFMANMFRVLTPFWIGLLIAYFINPLSKMLAGKIDRYIAKGKLKKITKFISVVISYVVILGFIIAAFVFVVPEVIQSIRELMRKVPAMYTTLMKGIDFLAEQFPEIDQGRLNEQLANVLPNLAKMGTNAMGSVLNIVYSWSVSVVKTAINIILGIFISVYMIYSKDMFEYQAKRLVYALWTEEKGDAICETSRECNDIFAAFLISKAIDSLIIGILCCILMTALDLPYAVLLSVIVGITNMIPYFGPFIGAVPGVLILLCLNWEHALIFAIMILVLQQFDGIILGPRLLGQSTGLGPIWVIFGVTVGGAYFGVIGMFIGVPVVAVIAHLCNKWLEGRLEGKHVEALKDGEKKS